MSKTFTLGYHATTANTPTTAVRCTAKPLGYLALPESFTNKDDQPHLNSRVRAP